VLISLEMLVDAVVYIEGQCIGPSLDVRVGLALWDCDQYSITSAGRHCSWNPILICCQGSKATIGDEPGIMYIWAEQEGDTENPGVTNGIQLVVTPLLTCAGQVVVMITTDWQSTGTVSTVLRTSKIKRIWAGKTCSPYVLLHLARNDCDAI
jgi:hypothetical protein